MSEATMSQAFTSFAAEAGYGAQSADLGSQSTDLGFPERRLLPGENVVARRVTRSFSLIMEAYEHDQTLAAASVPQQQAFPLPDPGTFLPPQHMRILCESDAPPPSIRELYSRYGGNGQSSNLTALSAVDKKKNKPESKIPEIPKKQVDELMRALRHDKESAEAPKKKRASAAPSLKPSKAIKKLHHSPDLEARPRLGGLGDAHHVLREEPEHRDQDPAGAGAHEHEEHNLGGRQEGREAEGEGPQGPEERRGPRHHVPRQGRGGVRLSLQPDVRGHGAPRPAHQVDHHGEREAEDQAHHAQQGELRTSLQAGGAGQHH